LKFIEGNEMDFKTSKNLGGIGALLMFIGCMIPGLFGDYFSLGVPIVGFILVLVSLYGFASFYKENGIFNNALFGGLAAIIGCIVASVVAVVVVLTSIVNFLYQIFPGWNGDYASLQDLTPNITNIDISTLTPFFTGIALILVILWIFSIITAIFAGRSLKKLAQHSDTNLFATTSTIMLIGAVIPILGLLFIWISLLILAIAFFTMKEPNPTPPPTYTTTPPPPPQV
jgi:uncharacterized membrane protein